MEEKMTMEGRLVRRLENRVLRLMAGATGALAVLAVLRLVFGWIVGLRRPCTVTLDGAGVEIDWSTSMLGRQSSTRTVRIPAWKVDRIERESRFRFAHVIIGSLFFLIGTGTGFALVVDWAWTRFGIYLLAGLGFMALGAAVDAAVIFLVPAARKLSTIVIVSGSTRWRVEGVPDATAVRFMDAVVKWFESARAGQGAAAAPPPTT